MNGEKMNSSTIHSEGASMNNYLVINYDITTLKTFLTKQYENQVVKPGKKRQEHWDNMLYDRSAELWTTQ